ncbi:nuclear localization sequence binding protein [Atractiella rhizophila]|nr:nuclear localization sequence binding protein [Atractiella rhizophila]
MHCTMAVSQALDTLYRNPDQSAKDNANNWLQDFQHTEEAWNTVNTILLGGAEVAEEARVFAAQTFRSKINYDLEQIPRSQLPALKDSLLLALRTFAIGPRVIRTQISLSLADLALQMPEWTSVMTQVTDEFGQDPATVPALLEFLTQLPQEVTSNYRIEVLNEEFRTRTAVERIAGLLSMYIQASGVTVPLQVQIMRCLGSWLRAGEMPAALVVDSHLFPFAFKALRSNDSDLFDAAVDVVCDLIHETQELEDSMAVIQRIVPELISLKPELSTVDTTDSDRMRGFCRIFCEAGEWYEPLMLQHQETFLPIVQAIVECSACKDLDIVPITFSFWYKLAKGLKRSPPTTDNSAFLKIYSELVGTIIQHLYYPDDDRALTGQERDDFREFRHAIGDTLKDCCSVLGANTCLRRSYDLIAAALMDAQTTGTVKWQAVEAPLFSMRTMGAEVDVQDNEVMPSIMDMMQKLPSHPKIQYAAILVIARYTEWVEYHPEHISFLLSYISAGFESNDPEVVAAAAQALKFLANDCSSHLIPYLAQLHTFMKTQRNKLQLLDIIDISAAVAHVIVSMPSLDACTALSTFCLPLLENIHEACQLSTSASKDVITRIQDDLEQLDTFLSIVGRLDDLPASCEQSCAQAWSVINNLILKFGSSTAISERAATAIRRGLTFFGQLALGIVPAMVQSMGESFEAHGHASYLWITGKLLSMYGRLLSDEVRQGLGNVIDRETLKIFATLQNTPASQIPDVLDDYAHLIYSVVTYTPNLLFLSPSFPVALQILIQSLTLPSTDTVIAVLDALREIVGNDSLDLPSSAPSTPLAPGPADPSYAVAIRSVLDQHGYVLIGILLNGVAITFHEDCSPTVITLFRLLSEHCPNQLSTWVSQAAERALPTRDVGLGVREKFLSQFGVAMSEGNPNKVKEAFVNLYKACKRTRDRSSLASRQM